MKGTSYPLVMSNIAIENGPVEIVSFPMKNGGSFHSFLYVYQAGLFSMNSRDVSDGFNKKFRNRNSPFV